MSSDASGFGLAKINPLRYRGYYYDQETGLYYLQTRYYDPKVRRFLNADDASVLTKDPEQLTEKNLYAYCDDNPVMYRDDAGMFVITSTAITLAVAGGIINSIISWGAAKATGQTFGKRDLLIAFAAGCISGSGTLIESELIAAVAGAVVCGVGTAIINKNNGDDRKQYMLKGCIAGGLTLLSPCTLINIKAVATDGVKVISSGILGIGSGCSMAAGIAAVPYLKKKTYGSSIKNNNQVHYKNTLGKSRRTIVNKTRRQQAWKHFLFKMNQLKPY